MSLLGYVHFKQIPYPIITANYPIQPLEGGADLYIPYTDSTNQDEILDIGINGAELWEKFGNSSFQAVLADPDTSDPVFLQLTLRPSKNDKSQLSIKFGLHRSTTILYENSHSDPTNRGPKFAIFKHSSRSYRFYMVLLDSVYDWGTMPASTVTANASEVKIVDSPPIPTNFYRTSPEGDISLARGESVELKFNLVYSDGSFGDYTDIVYETVSAGGNFTLENNVFTVNEDARATLITLTARPNIEGTELFAIINVNVTNTLGPYDSQGNSIPGGGIAGGGIGTAPVPPGILNPQIPDSDNIETGIPIGSSGNDIAKSGMYTKYLCNQASLNVLAQFLWEDNVGIQALKAVFGNPIESILSLISYPFDLTTLVVTASQNMFFGKYDSLLSFNAITKSSIQIDWGTINLPFFWGNFLDYSPHTTIQVFLPWGPGFVSIDPNEVMPYSSEPNNFNLSNFTTGSIQVITNIELDKGSCVHNIIGNKNNVIASYGGVVGKQIPLVALDTASKSLALITAAATGTAAIASGLAGAARGAYTSTKRQWIPPHVQASTWTHIDVNKFNAGQMVGDIASSKSGKAAAIASSTALLATPPNYPRAGTFSDGTNSLTVQRPYIIVSRPSQSVPAEYGKYYGYPSNIYYSQMSQLSGYTEIGEIHLDNIPATEAELAELDSILKGGVIL